MSDQPAGPSRWTRGDRRILASTRVLEVRAVHYRHPSRKDGREYVVLTAPDWVNVVAVTKDRRIVLVRQFRFGVDDFSLEVPGGVIESGEAPLAAAVRELREETGYGSGSEPRLLGSVYPNPAIQDNRCHLVLIEGVEKVSETGWDEDEEIEVMTLPVAEGLEWARTGKIRHSLVICALFHYEQWLKSGSKSPTG